MKGPFLLAVVSTDQRNDCTSTLMLITCRNVVCVCEIFKIALVIKGKVKPFRQSNVLECIWIFKGRYNHFYPSMTLTLSIYRVGGNDSEVGLVVMSE